MLCLFSPRKGERNFKDISCTYNILHLSRYYKLFELLTLTPYLLYDFNRLLGSSVLSIERMLSLMNGTKRGTSTERAKIKSLMSNENIKYNSNYRKCWDSMFQHAVKNSVYHAKVSSNILNLRNQISRGLSVERQPDK